MQKVFIVPCYNEANRLPVEKFFHFIEKNDEIFFLFVNDGSGDSTLEVIQRMSEENSRCLYLDLEHNGGKAEAVRAGMIWAYENCSAGYIGFWDADLATPLEEIPQFISEAENRNFEMVTGLRLKRLGAKVKRKTSRHYLGRIFATVASAVLGLPVFDTQCGAKLYRKEIVGALFETPFLTRWLFDVELLARYIRIYGKDNAEKKIYEYPVYQWEDIGGSRLKLKDFMKAPYELYKIKMKYLRKKN